MEIPKGIIPELNPAINPPTQTISPLFTATDVEKVLRQEIARQCFIKPFENSATLQKLLPDLAKYMLGIPGALNIKKSLLIRGNTGAGKSVIIEAMQRTYRRMRLKIESELLYRAVFEKDPVWKLLFSTYSEGKIYKTYECTDKSASGKSLGGKTALNHITNTYNKTDVPNHISIDDVGTQKSNNAHHYNEEINPCDYILQTRYEGFCKTYGELKTHITTNLDDEKLAQWIGARAYSRTLETHNIVEITGKDYRK